LPSKN